MMSRKYISAMFATAGIAAMSMFAFSPAAQAQPGCNECPTVGQVICCPGSSLTSFQGFGYTITLTATTNGCFIITSCTPPPPCQWQVQMSLSNFDGVGTDPNLGTIHWRN